MPLVPLVLLVRKVIPAHRVRKAFKQDFSNPTQRHQAQSPEICGLIPQTSIPTLGTTLLGLLGELAHKALRASKELKGFKELRAFKVHQAQETLPLPQSRVRQHQQSIPTTVKQ